jgi:cation:H+ antiporter
VDYIIFIAALSALIYGAEFVITQSEKIALHFDISPFVIGATLIALGTSLPEMAASISASYKGQSDMAVANVIGSNIFNIAMVLGAVFLVSKAINPSRDIFAKDSAWGLFPILVFILMSLDGVLDRFEGLLFLVMMGAYVMFLIDSAADLSAEVDEEDDKEAFGWGSSIALLLVGFTLIVVGGNYTIESGANIARSFGISEWIVGMMLIALGTSLPELVVSIKAAMKGQAEMSIGNIIGSNVANFTIVLGSAALVAPLTIDLSKNAYDILMALIVSFMLVFITANKIYNKSTGIVLLITLALVINNTINSI